jgi:WD40 repeat protein
LKGKQTFVVCGLTRATATLLFSAVQVLLLVGFLLGEDRLLNQSPDVADTADHIIHCYDIRNMREETATFRGHSKAVSYVRFLNTTELVSASTDSTLKLWDTTTANCTRTVS